MTGADIKLQGFIRKLISFVLGASHLNQCLMTVLDVKLETFKSF